MIRTNVVKLTTIPAIGFRQKLTAGGSGITILRPDAKQPGIASISKTSGEAIPSKNTDTKLYPLEAFKEVMNLTLGMPYKKQGNVKVTADMVAVPAEETKEEPVEEEVIVSSEDYDKIVSQYLDKNGVLSYDLMNRDFIRFMKSSTIVNEMIVERSSEKMIRSYIVGNRFRNITGNDDLTDREIAKIVELLDEVSPRGVFKELNSEIRKALGSAKRE